jgi:uncharacterized protein YndB with AHSA1/START domain
MASKKKSLSFTQIVNAEPALVYQAFTNATILREYLCNVASVEPKLGGRIYLAWDNGYYSAGCLTRLSENQALGFTWMGRDDPGPTQVEINFPPHEAGTLVNLDHRGLGSGETWENPAREFKKGWEQGLENLASLLETGADLRLTRRPMLGILYADFNAEIAGELAVPVSEGVRLGGVVDGLSAQKAGLQKNDVLVELAGVALKEWGDLAPILQGHRAGERVELVYYRGGARHSISMTLAQRPLPEIPWKVEELAAAVKQHNQDNLKQIEKMLSGVSEAEASHKPTPAEWNIKEILIHLISGERAGHFNTAELVGGHERWADDYGQGEFVVNQGLLAVYPTLVELLAELKRTYQATDAIAAALPAEFALKRKGSYWRLAYNWLQPDYHLQDHLEQMKTCLDSVRNA